MPRRPTPLGTAGKATIVKVGSSWRARIRFRDLDGVPRVIERFGKTKGAANAALAEAVRDRVAPTGSEITADSKFSEAVALYLSAIDDLVAAGHRSPNTARLYRGAYKREIKDRIGELRIRECTVPRVDAFIKAVRKAKGDATAKTCRAVVSGALGLATRHGALTANPIRDAEQIEGRPKKPPRALTAAEREAWLNHLRADKKAKRWELADLSVFMLGTGVRIGEALAVEWRNVDLDAQAVEIEATIIRVKGVGLIRHVTKSAAGERPLWLPDFVVDMLRERAAVLGDPAGPVFPSSVGTWRDPSNMARVLREARDAAGFDWLTSHNFRKTTATILDDAGLSARQIADQLGHARPSMTQDVYMARKQANSAAADALDQALGGLGRKKWVNGGSAIEPDKE